MSDIIDTGLGWWANEDWLKDDVGYIGKMSNGIINDLKDLPIYQNVAPTYDELMAAGYHGWTTRYLGCVITPYGQTPSSVSTAKTKLVAYKPGSVYQLLVIVNTPAGADIDVHIYATEPPSRVFTTASLRSTTAATSSPDWSYFQINVGWSSTMVFYDIYVANASTASGAIAEVFGGADTSFYKLHTGYAVSCFIRWINANQQESVAPILVSTDQNAVDISINGTDPAAGIVTGIEFGGMTFYINVLVGYSGTVSAAVPYQDITATFPDGINITELFRAIATFAQIRFSDPYREAGISGPGGGGGTFDFTSTDVPIPTLPTIGAYDTGFISLYRPAESELRSLAAYLWSGPFDLDNFKKIFANPMDCILGLHIIPTAGAHPLGSSSALMVGNISTGLSMQRLTEQYYELDCGTITIDPKWGAYLDYSPYSKLSLFLPYIGFVTISPDDCMNGSIRVVYHVDVLSGSCCVYVYCASNQGADGHTLYTFTGGCACDCPVTEGQYTNGLFGSLRGGIGLAAGLLSASPAGIMGGIEEAANAALSMVKPDVGRSGSFGGSAGLMGIQYPYLVLTIPKMCTPGDQNIYRGYPSFVTEELGNISGYASVEITHMENMSATDDEVSEIMGLLGEGVIF